jgi:hypothetical protein
MVRPPVNRLGRQRPSRIGLTKAGRTEGRQPPRAHRPSLFSRKGTGLPTGNPWLGLGPVQLLGVLAGGA